MQTSSLKIRRSVRCPHCWSEYSPEDSLYIAEHPSLARQDKKIKDGFLRFLPTRFSAEGDGLDPLGARTSRLACPNCHLEVPRTFYETPGVIFSIVGSMASGKSNLIGAMSKTLREILPRQFGISIKDADILCNKRLLEYEKKLFFPSNPEEFVALEKTEKTGDFYNQVQFGRLMGSEAEHIVAYLKPFIFQLQPIRRTFHSMDFDVGERLSRLICLYDNAGEDFEPEADTADRPVTRHLPHSRCILFAFDPTQHPRIANEIARKSNVSTEAIRATREDSFCRQDTILTEAIQRYRRLAAVRSDKEKQIPVIVIVTKWDTWKNLFPELLKDGKEFPPPPITSPDPGLSEEGANDILDFRELSNTSCKLAHFIQKYAPEVIDAAQGFASPLIFIPMSALGVTPVRKDPPYDPKGMYVQPKDINPIWAEVPIMTAIALTCDRLIESQGSFPSDIAEMLRIGKRLVDKERDQS